jgi:hypothetical protein
MSSIYLRYQQATEYVKHVLVEYQEVYTFWFGLYQVLKFPQYS